MFFECRVPNATQWALGQTLDQVTHGEIEIFMFCKQTGTAHFMFQTVLHYNLGIMSPRQKDNLHNYDEHRIMIPHPLFTNTKLKLSTNYKNTLIHHDVNNEKFCSEPSWATVLLLAVKIENRAHRLKVCGFALPDIIALLRKSDQ